MATHGSKLTEPRDNTQNLRYLATVLRLEMNKVQLCHGAESGAINGVEPQRDEAKLQQVSMDDTGRKYLTERPGMV